MQMAKTALCMITNLEIEISTEESALKLLVIPTDEELLIAQDTYELAK